MFEDRPITDLELTSLIAVDEDHFFDFKGKNIQPAKLQETFVAFANADGGDIYVGIEDAKFQGTRAQPFSSKEEANAVISVLLENTTPAVEGVNIEFLCLNGGGYILHISIPKSPKVHYTSSGDCFVRLNAGKVKIKGERVTSLAYSKGSLPYEKVPIEGVSIDEIAASDVLLKYMERVKTSLLPPVFLRKQRLLSDKNGTSRPNVGCVLLFDEEPQASIETRCAVKVYRLRTSSTEYNRDNLAEMPATINGTIEIVILETIKKVAELLEGASYYDGGNLVPFRYPAKALKEILVNAVIHRDYSLNDDIHVKIYDNRIEISSPGKLPGYVNLSNIYSERFSRNPNIVRMLHNLPNPLEHFEVARNRPF